MTAAAAAAEANEANSAARAPGAGNNNNNRYSYSLDANSNDPWAALGGIEALAGATTTIQMEQTHSSSESTTITTTAASSTQRRRRSRHVSFLPPIDAISPMPTAPASPPPPVPAISSSLGAGRMRPSASTPSMAQIQMPTPVHHNQRQRQHQQQNRPQLRGILRNSSSSANIHRTPSSSATTPNRSVFPIYPSPSPDPLAAMRRPDSFMPGEDVAVSRNATDNDDEDGRYSRPPPSYDAVMASTRYESNNRAS
ncbi:hypothetical protein LPJ72_004031 [Coemansia sp. Benny D160-2]|nr:hypothetical protein LPJ72_004031 [Coemansia sp. Benny D160-2]